MKHKFGIPKGQPIELTSALMNALAAAQSDAETVAKDGKNEHHNFKYATAESVLLQKKALNIHGLALLPMGHGMRPSKIDQGWADLKRTYWLTHSDGGYVVLTQLWMYQPHRGTPWDKALAAGLTSSLGYQMRDILGISRPGEGDDISGRDDRDYDPRGGSRPAARNDRAADVEAQGREQAAMWLHGCPPVDATKEERRAYMDKAKTKKLGSMSLRVIGARLWAMANIAAGKLDEDGMSEQQCKDLELGKELMMETPMPVSDGDQADDTLERVSEAVHNLVNAGSVGEVPKSDGDGDGDGAGKSAPKKAAETKGKKTAAKKATATGVGKSAPKKPAKQKGKPPAEPTPETDGGSKTPHTTSGSDGDKGEAWDVTTQRTKLGEFLTFIEGSPSPDDFIQLAVGPKMHFDGEHMTLLGVAVELRKATMDDRAFDPAICTKGRLDALRSIIDGTSNAG